MKTGAEIKNVTVVGAGSWGTALADLLAGNGRPVKLWVYEEEVYSQILTDRENTTFLPGFKLHEGVTPVRSLDAALAEAEVAVLVFPSHIYRTLAGEVCRCIKEGAVLVSATKGIENETGLLPTEILEEVFPGSFYKNICVLSGPSFAREVVAKKPTAVTVASHDKQVAKLVQEVFSRPYFRVYTSVDVIGVELGGAIKNVIAIASGMIDGLDLGSNTRAALITRGLAEITRLGKRLGANPMTFSGLAGIGDLVLTCTSKLSRNYSVGYEIGRGRTLTDILSGMAMVAEGVKNTMSIKNLCRRLDIELPICDEVYDILYENKSPLNAVRDLMTRHLKDELEYLA
ncbi:MAG: NAD(P)-dependent glycerol-3-phosphate dehydrogenase [Deltaproteobacteria bacterium]|nr:NAD(P)-dependent glycerol-3-phosphate dehydrogenase [Deltaproteobacteria bacterium]